MAGTACQDNTTLITGEAAPTAISVDPALFLGGVPCLPAPGSLTYYVATLYDSYETRNGTQEFALPSSGPVPCNERVQFEWVVPGRQYVADIQAYDQTGLRPLVPGSPVLVGDDGQIVEPRWTSCCGRPHCGPSAASPAVDAGTEPDASPEASVTTKAGTPADAGPSTEAGAPLRANTCTIHFTDAGIPSQAGPTCSVAQRTIPIRGCRPLQQIIDRNLPTGIRIDTARLASSIGCGAGSQQIERFEFELSGPVAPEGDGGSQASQKVSCGAEPEWTGLVPGGHYVFAAGAFEAGATGPAWTTQCYGVAVQELVITASCDPLAPVAVPERDR